jgi:anti-sigma regulatory factor (Ser/Thr protein kinase)
MVETPSVHLSLTNRAENVLVVRQALTGVAASLGLDALETNDLNTAVTEACNNVVVHAYGGAEGPLAVDAFTLANTLAVVVRDRGRGIPAPAADHEEGRFGMGLAVIDALTHRAQFTHPSQGGTQVLMEFLLPGGSSLPVGSPAAGQLDDEADARGQAGGVDGGHANVVELQLAPTELARAVLPRVLCALAARAHFTTDRIADIQVVAEVLAMEAGDSIHGSHLGVGVSVTPRRLELRLGPLHPGRGESVMAAAADGLAPLIERLTDGQRVSPDASGERLELDLIDRR